MTRAFCCVALLLVCHAVGCQPKKVEHEVTGTITIDGSPIDQGSITFLAADGVAPSGGGAITNGVYKAWVPPGEKLVLVIGYKLVGQEPLYEGVPDSPMRDKLEMVTPPAYNAGHLTSLTASITGPQTGLDFDLKKDFKGK